MESNLFGFPPPTNRAPTSTRAPPNLLVPPLPHHHHHHHLRQLLRGGGGQAPPDSSSSTMQGCFAIGGPACVANDSTYFTRPSKPSRKCHLLEVSVVSAQDLYPATRSMSTFAVAYIDPDNQMRSRVDSRGHTDPSWKDKFVFRIDDATLRSDVSALTINIYAKAPGFIFSSSDVQIGTARVLLSTFRLSKNACFVALQVRRPRSLRPQGIVNIGVALIDANVRTVRPKDETAPPAAAVARHQRPPSPSAKAHMNQGARPTKSPSGGRERGDKGIKKTPAPKAGGEPASDHEAAELERKLKMWREELPQSRQMPQPRQAAGGERAERRRSDGEEEKNGENGGNQWLRSPRHMKYSCKSSSSLESDEFVPVPVPVQAEPHHGAERRDKQRARRPADDW